MRIGPLTITFGPPKAPPPDVLAAFEHIKRLEIAVRALADDLSQLQGHHLKLRKQFDGSKGGRPTAPRGELEEIPRGDKAALRRALGVVPGRPYNHQE